MLKTLDLHFKTITVKFTDWNGNNGWQLFREFQCGGPQLSRQNQNLTAKTKTSRQNQKPHGKNKNLTAKPKTSRQNQMLEIKNPIPWNTSRQKQILTAKPKLFCFCCEVFGFAERFFVLPWGFWFCMRFLVLLWCFCFCREVFSFAVTVVGHHRHVILRSLTFETKSEDETCAKV